MFWKDYWKPSMWIALSHLWLTQRHTRCAVHCGAGGQSSVWVCTARDRFVRLSTGGGMWLQEGIILFAYLHTSAWPSTTWAGWCLGTELNVSSKWPAFHRLTASPSFMFLYDRNRSFPTYCCTRLEPIFKEQPAVLLGVVYRLLRLSPESHSTNMWSIWDCPSHDANLSIM